MKKTQFSLLFSRRFWPLFLCQFFGALNDNVFKNALVVLITYVFSIRYHYNAQIAIVFAALLFMLPFVLFSPLAGELADSHEKSRLVRIIKFIEIILIASAIIGFYLDSTSILMIILFLMGTQSTFFGPIKYSALPSLLKEDELIAGNALIQASTYIAILLGSVAGTLIILQSYGKIVLSLCLIFFAFIGWAVSWFLPSLEIKDAHISLNFNIFLGIKKMIKISLDNPVLFRTMIAISWFWLIGATYVTQFPSFVKDILHANESVVGVCLIVFSIGIGFGALLCNTLLKSKITVKYVSLACLGMILAGVDLFFASKKIILLEGPLVSYPKIFTDFAYLRIILDLGAVALFGGFYVVPLYALLQKIAKPTFRSRIIAANNILNAIFMMTSAGIIILLLNMGLSIPTIFLIFSLASLIMLLYLKNLKLVEKHG